MPRVRPGQLHDLDAALARDQTATAGRLRVLELVTHTYPLAEAATAFTLLHESPEQALQVLLSFEEVGA